MVLSLRSEETRSEAKILLDSIFDREPVGSSSPFERDEEDDNAPLAELMHQMVFGNHNQWERIMINPHSILRMRVQRNKEA